MITEALPRTAARPTPAPRLSPSRRPAPARSPSARSAHRGARRPRRHRRQHALVLGRASGRGSWRWSRPMPSVTARSRSHARRWRRVPRGWASRDSARASPSGPPGSRRPMLAWILEPAGARRGHRRRDRRLRVLGRGSRPIAGVCRPRRPRSTSSSTRGCTARALTADAWPALVAGAAARAAAGVSTSAGSGRTSPTATSRDTRERPGAGGASGRDRRRRARSAWPPSHAPRELGRGHPARRRRLLDGPGRRGALRHRRVPRPRTRPGAFARR